MKTSRLSKLISYHTLTPIILIALYFILNHLSTFPQRIENLFIDWRFQIRAFLGWTPKAPEKLIIVGIDEPSLAHFGGWPWSRDVHGDLIRLLTAAEPAAVAFDILFTEPRDETHDTYLSQAASELKKLITGAMSDLENARTSDTAFGLTQPLTQIVGDINQVHGTPSAILPIHPLREKSYFGFVNSEPDPDGVRRSLPLVVRVGNQLFPSLALQTLIVAHEIPIEQIKVHLGRHISFPLAGTTHFIPIDHQGCYTLNYRDFSRYRSISYLALTQALARTYAQGQPWPTNFPTLQNAILLIGQNAAGLTDIGPTPLAPATPLVFVHLTALANILENDHLNTLPPALVLLIWLLITSLSLYLLRSAPFLLSTLIPTGLILLYILLAIYLTQHNYVTLPLFWPIIGFFLAHFGAFLLRWRAEQKSKAHLKQIFGSYIAPGILQELLKNPDKINLGGQRKPVTILFSDIRSFTSLSEGADEIALVDQLNEYFEKMVACVNAQGGTLHKYIGDAIMAVWGDILSHSPSQDATAAVRSALAMRYALAELNQNWQTNGRPPLKIGIGLNHGTVLVGNIGATQRKEFTVIGDPVNLASRLEGVTKIFHTDIVISESVQALLPDTILTRLLATVQVKGKNEPVRIHEVIADLTTPQHPPYRLPDWVKTYEEALSYYYRRNFHTAQSLLAQCLQRHPDDYCAQGYYELCTEYLRHPPEPNWQGIFILDTK
ncbi:MAG: adenylate/guanylate cyclase domain-containing protein [Methylacidiphilales bacterium]|nr:adenylate/guanylate cyclase domain-containing protein [Candidatus Methylacidiphilales bacterium]MDW8350122.1 adenylate/guanylate cyclase domain-containing protein [Verrucomicrobiae bacterium]